MPYSWQESNTLTPTPEELRSLFLVRLEALEAAIEQTTLEGSLPVRERWGWKACIVPIARDSGGHLLASVRVLNPAGRGVYCRRVRLVRPARLKLV